MVRKQAYSSLNFEEKFSVFRAFASMIRKYNVLTFHIKLVFMLERPWGKYGALVVTELWYKFEFYCYVLCSILLSFKAFKVIEIQI